MDFDLKAHTILLTLAGSRVYGLETPTSDVDIKGICIPPLQKYRLGILHNFEQADSREEIKVFLDTLLPEEQEICKTEILEGQVYDIKKFFSLALNANPNILEILFCDDKYIRTITPAGEEIRENRNIFLSKKAAYSYRGYSFAQLRRIKTHRSWLLNPPKEEPKRKDFSLPSDHSSLTQDQQNAFLWVLAKILEDKIGTFKLSKSTKEELLALSIYDTAAAGIPDNAWPVIQGMMGAPNEFIEMMMRERKYRLAREHWNSYLNWKKTRNSKRAELEKICGYDSKHGAHLYRLMLQGREIIENHTLTVTLSKEQKERAISIRNGEVPFGELEEWFNAEEKTLDIITEKSTLPKEPDRIKANELLIELQGKD